MKKIIVTIFGALIFCLLPIAATGQSIVAVNIPTDICAGTQQQIHFGFDPNDNIVVEVEGNSTMGNSERTFLPDGVVCGGKCSYESSGVFTGFYHGAVITSVEDIHYIRLKMEHSYLGDIYMGVKCPNGQKASLMNWSSRGTSNCTDSVPMSQRGWGGAYANANEGAYLGNANDVENGSNICDSTATGNEPGTGWNYCFSDASEIGYIYAPQDGRIYRAANAHTYNIDGTNKTIIDSSDIYFHTHIYHPDTPFDSLIGCPLNGRWTVEVIDAFSLDNGYIFEWELALDPHLLVSDSCRTIESYAISGGNSVQIDSATFELEVPPMLLNDTTIVYTFQVINHCGYIVDTTVAITYHPAIDINYDTTVCDQFELMGRTYTHDTAINSFNQSIYGCDSNIHLNLTVFPSSHYTLDTTVCEYLIWQMQRYNHDTAFSFNHLTIHGCDSSGSVRIAVRPVYSDTLTMEGCDNLPYEFDGHPLYNGINTIMYTSVDGCDSNLLVDLMLHPTYDLYFNEVICPGTSIEFDGITYTISGVYTQNYSTVKYGCDSLRTLMLNVSSGDLKAAIKAIPLMVTPEDLEIRLYDNSRNSTDRLWMIEQQTFSTAELTYTYPEALDSLEIMLVAISGHNCTDTATATARIDRSRIVVPNIFTPTLENNKVWSPVSNEMSSMETWIYNRQGHLVAHLKNVDEAWDGNNLEGLPCPQAAYVYTMRYRSKARPDREQTMTGTITLLR